MCLAHFLHVLILVKDDEFIQTLENYAQEREEKENQYPIHQNDPSLE